MSFNILLSESEGQQSSSHSAGGVSTGAALSSYCVPHVETAAPTD